MQDCIVSMLFFFLKEVLSFLSENFQGHLYVKLIQSMNNVLVYHILIDTINLKNRGSLVSKIAPLLRPIDFSGTNLYYTF